MALPPANTSSRPQFDAKGNPIEKRKRKRNRSPANPDKPPPRRKPVLDEETYAELANKVGVFGNNERKVREGGGAREASTKKGEEVQ